MKATLSVKYHLDCQGGILVIDDSIDFCLKEGFSVDETKGEIINLVQKTQEQVRESIGKGVTGNMVIGTKVVDISKIVVCELELRWHDD